MSLVFCGVPYLIGYLILSYAHYMSTAYGFKVLAITGRFLTGVGMGWAGSVGPVSQQFYNCIVQQLHHMHYSI